METSPFVVYLISLLCSLYTMYTQNITSDENDTSSEPPFDTSLLDCPITCNEVRKAVSTLKVNKSPGLDSLPPELFIDTVDLLADVMCKLFNYMFVNSKYPEKWTRQFRKRVI